MLSCFRQSWLSIGSNQSLFERCSRFVFGTGTRSSFDPKNSGFAKMYSRLVCPSPVPQNAGSCYRWVCQSAVCLHSQKINFTKIFVKNDFTENSFFSHSKKFPGLQRETEVPNDEKWLPPFASCHTFEDFISSIQTFARTHYSIASSKSWIFD